jgi:hypothetical protein
MNGWVIPASLTAFDVNNTILTGSPDLTSSIVLNQYSFMNCGLSQADIDSIVVGVYNQRMSFTDGSPQMRIDGTNAVASGIFQAASPPTTPMEMIYTLINDNNGEGFSKWYIYYNP